MGKGIFDVIERQSKIQDGRANIKEISVRDKITFKDVTFRYPTALPTTPNVLTRATFSIPACTTTAIIGPSGAGKSTIVQLIERFYDPEEGQVYFDDTDIKDYNLNALRCNMGYVQQEPVLILGSIRDNLMFGNSDATQKDIDESLKRANADFVYSIEGGIDSYIGSAAVLNLSGGQKQRIAIARALIKKPKLLLLDEATSALDPKSEQEVQTAINAISQE